MALTGCSMRVDTRDGSTSFSPAQKAAVEQEVRRFVSNVARDVTQEGPAAWEKHFADSPSFFMALEGRLQFPDRQSATQGIDALTRTIQHIELNWGEDLRVDPLTPDFAGVATSWHEVIVDKQGHQFAAGGFFTGLVEHHNGQWQFRNAHWSVAAPSKAP
jgi:hypothetical protein